MQVPHPIHPLILEIDIRLIFIKINFREGPFEKVSTYGHFASTKRVVLSTGVKAVRFTWLTVPDTVKLLYMDPAE